jgi:hypothetical protein
LLTLETTISPALIFRTGGLAVPVTGVCMKGATSSGARE